DIPVFCLQNGVRNEELAAEHFPRVYGVMVRVGGVYLTDGEVIARRDPPGWLIIGRYPSGIDEIAERVALSLRSAGFFTMLTPDVMPYKWGKLMGNLANAIGAITNAHSPTNQQIAEAARAEARELLAQAGIRWIPHEELEREWPEITLPPRHRLDVEAQSSTWQSLARRQGSVETDFLNGEIVRLAKRLGRQAPINEALLRITQEMAAHQEPPGKYSPDELRSLLGLEGDPEGSRPWKA
ncbi:MAG: 2-dehydropantoate 2-reductase, partial [Chloroflexi bacterium]|nr:2-dehydropantoate 2-reductase [Chloroflexota bacterium]